MAEGPSAAQLAAQRKALAEKEAELAAQGVELAEAKLRLETRASRLPEGATQAQRKREEDAKAELENARHRAVQANKKVVPAWRDWGNRFGGLPDEVLEKVAETLVAQHVAAYEKRLKRIWSEEEIQERLARWKRDGNCLFVFARVCKEWRKAQLKVGGPLRTRLRSDVIAPGSMALVKWALAEGCPRDDGYGPIGLDTMARAAALYGHRELVQWLCGEGGFAMDEYVMGHAAFNGNLELVQWLRGKGCPWNHDTCSDAVEARRVEVLRWIRENGAPWTAEIRDRAAETLGYTDELGNLVNAWGNPIQ